MDRNIKIVVKDRVATAVGQPCIVCGNTDYTITFSFDEEWADAKTKTARFKYLTGEGVKHQDQSFTGDMVNVPAFINIREVEVGVFAGGLATTTGAPLRCDPSICCGSGEGEENVIQSAKDAAYEEYRANLETTLNEATGEDHTGQSWEELNESVKTSGSRVDIVLAELEAIIDESGVLV